MSERRFLDITKFIIRNDGALCVNGAPVRIFPPREGQRFFRIQSDFQPRFDLVAWTLGGAQCAALRLAKEADAIERAVQ